ncbi:hypothetical protein ACFFHF_17205 [Robertmurraya beringensis]|uniref:Uncharacterized protein n=1 Tax=Robertmurraya beringensis TaxID=641660 RepID=A0ABV6KUE1_9BACI
MSDLITSHLEEYAGHKFYVEHVSTSSIGNWFRVHMTNGVIHNLTIGYADSIEKAKQEVIKAFKEYLDGVL